MCTFVILGVERALASCYVLYTEMVQGNLHVYTVVGSVHVLVSMHFRQQLSCKVAN